MLDVCQQVFRRLCIEGGSLEKPRYQHSDQLPWKIRVNFWYDVINYAHGLCGKLSATGSLEDLGGSRYQAFGLRLPLPAVLLRSQSGPDLLNVEAANFRPVAPAA